MQYILAHPLTTGLGEGGGGLVSKDVLAETGIGSQHKLKMSCPSYLDHSMLIGSFIYFHSFCYNSLVSSHKFVGRK